MAKKTTPESELLVVNKRLLEVIAAGDWAAYAELCDPSLTAFEPESAGHLVEGLDFHRFYFDLGGAKGPVNNTMGSPHVRVIGDVGVVCYVRLTQKTDDQGRPVTSCVMETRIWERQDGRWRHVHFHRSLAG